MSREIKFRAWGHLPDSNDYQMFHDVHLYQHHGVLMPAVNDFDNPVCDHSLMQYTGLKDQTGTEWWEGDIITPDDREDTSIAEIIFADGAFRKKYKEWDKASGHYPSIDYIDLEIFVVVGNIHESPELLK